MVTIRRVMEMPMVAVTMEVTAHVRAFTRNARPTGNSDYGQRGQNNYRPRYSNDGEYHSRSNNGGGYQPRGGYQQPRENRWGKSRYGQNEGGYQPRGNQGNYRPRYNNNMGNDFENEGGYQPRQQGGYQQNRGGYAPRGGQQGGFRPRLGTRWWQCLWRPSAAASWKL